MTGPTLAVSVPATSANLGAGFDVLGLALSLRARVGNGDPSPRGRVVDEHHPAAVAHRKAGGAGRIWVDSPIPMGRGLGFSGAMRAGGAALAVAGRRTDPGPLTDAERAEAYLIAAELEGHGDNAAASLYGGLVAVSGDRVVRVPVGFAAEHDPVVVVWVPDHASTSTDRSRIALADRIDRADAVFNLGRVAALVTGFATGDAELIGHGVEDRWHTAIRAEAAPAAARALDAARGAPIDAAWLSGSGPSVAMLCPRRHAAEVGAALPPDGHVKLLDIDHDGVTVARPSPDPHS